MLTILTTAWNKVYAYVAAIGIFVAAVAAVYLRGRSDANKDTERQVLSEDRQTRQISDTIRRDTAASDDVSSRLRRWQRPGS